MARRITPSKRVVGTTVRDPHPIGQRVMASLSMLAGRGIRGETGTIRYGYPSTATQRSKYTGYVFPPDLFIGWNPRSVAAGTVQNKVGQLPATSAPSGTYSPLLAAMAGVTRGQAGNPRTLPRGGN